MSIIENLIKKDDILVAESKKEFIDCMQGLVERAKNDLPDNVGSFYIFDIHNGEPRFNVLGSAL